ncbi:hypothetical protein C8Q74DRAFT_1395239 [Fomes fomentarius]|nr:hypothetical protein C8Q74DRAFT_1395239 [Fomes fomentarius]
MSASNQDFPSELLYTPEGQAFYTPVGQALEPKDRMWYPYPSKLTDYLTKSRKTFQSGVWYFMLRTTSYSPKKKKEDGFLGTNTCHVSFKTVQDPYRSRTGDGSDVGTVYFNAPVCDAKTGQVKNPDWTAFDGPFRDKAVGEKYSIRILPSGRDNKGHKSQYNLARQRKAITRARLAMDVYEALVKIWPDRVWHDITGVDVPFEHLVLVYVKCKSRKSVQPTFTYCTSSLAC